MPRVSIGLPFFNCRRTLTLALQSIFAQTYEDWELLLLDDGSSDGSLELAQAVDDPRVRVLADGFNKGLTTRLNELTRESKGEYIVRMDADDAMLPTRVERQVEALRADKTLDVVASASYLMSDDEAVYGMDSREPLRGGADMFLTLRSTWFAHPTVAAKRDWMLRFPYDETFRLGQERELFVRSYAKSKFRKLDAPLIIYREAGSTSLRAYREQRRTDRRLLRTYGPKVIGSRAAMALYAATYAKEMAYRTADACGLLRQFDERIALQRAVELTPRELDAADSSLKQVRATAVPGLHDSSDDLPVAFREAARLT
jgi:glycosyltransferase involved in cell wall biosynthesis